LGEGALAAAALGLLLVAAGYVAAVHAPPPPGPSPTSTTSPGMELCDHYSERVVFDDPDPSPGSNYFDGYLYWLVDGCDVFDVNVAYDYVPERPMAQVLGVYFKVYVDGELVYNGTSTMWDFPDDQYYGRDAQVDVYAYWIKG